MIICHCNVVSDRTIDKHVAQGACTADEIAACCGAGARCGSCRPMIVALLATRVVTESAQPAA